MLELSLWKTDHFEKKRGLLQAQRPSRGSVYLAGLERGLVTFRGLGVDGGLASMPANLTGSSRGGHGAAPPPGLTPAVATAQPKNATHGARVP